jgi:hypothetical protein
MAQAPSVIVNIINIQNVALDKTEDDPPIGAHRHRPKASEITFKGMKVKAWDLHIRDGFRSIQTRQNVTYLSSILANQTARIPVLVEAFQFFVANRSNRALP